MKRRVSPTIAMVGVLGMAGAACQLIAGIKSHEFQADVPPVEAGPPDVSVPDVVTIDPCEHKRPPSRPDAAFDEIRGYYVFAVRTVDFSGADDAGTPLGFDLDGVCTCNTDPATAHAGASSCTPFGATTCDYDGGVDNALYAPFKAAAAFLGSVAGGTALLGDQAECGRESLLFILGDYNGLADDPQVRVGLLPSFGIQEPHDAGEDPDSSCGNAGAAPFPARWDGTDTWSFTPQAGIGSGETVLPVISTPEAYVTGYRLVVPPVSTISLFLGAEPIEVSSPAVVANLVGVDGQGKDVAPGTKPDAFRIAGGVLSGRIAVGALLTSIGRLKTKSSVTGQVVDFCTDPVKGPIARTQICNGRDVQSDPAKDFQPPGAAPFPCDAVSTAVRFTAQPARVGSSYGPDAGPATCASDWAVCP